MSMQLRRKCLNDVSGVFSCVFSIEAHWIFFLLTWRMYAFQDCHSELAPTPGFIYVKNAHLIGLYSIYYYTSVLEEVCFLLRSLI